MISVSAGYGTDGSKTPTTVAGRVPSRTVLPAMSGALKEGAGCPGFAVAVDGTAMACSTAKLPIAARAATARVLLRARMGASVQFVDQLLPIASSTLAAVKICGSMTGSPPLPE